MQKVAPSSSLLTFLDHLEFTEAALLADPETEDLARPYTERIADWPDVFARERAGRRDVIRAEAVVQVRNDQLDRHTTRFGGQLLVESNNDRKSALFRRYFPMAPSEFVRQPLRKQVDHTLHVIIPELEKVPKQSPLRPFTTLLAKLAQAAVGALDARTKAKAARSTSSSDVEEWKEDVNRLRLGTYAALLQIAAEKGYGKAWADTFFWSPSRGETDEPEPEPTTAPQPA